MESLFVLDFFEARSEPAFSDLRLPVPPLLTERPERGFIDACWGRGRDGGREVDDGGGTDDAGGGGTDDVGGGGTDDAGSGGTDDASGGEKADWNGGNNGDANCGTKVDANGDGKVDASDGIIEVGGGANTGV